MSGILEVYGAATSLMHIQRGDFLLMTDKEFEAAAAAFYDNEEQKERAEWERMRMLAVMTMQPHTRQRLNARKLLPFPWDPKPEITEKAEARRRFDDARGRLAGQTAAKESDR